MRWFKHISNAHNDEFLAEVLDVFGLEGYGLWFICLEMIAGEMDETPATSARFHVKTWSRNARISLKKWSKIVGFFAEKGKIIVKKDGDFVTLDCPNLAEYRDEWSRKKGRSSGQTPELHQRESGAAPEQSTEYRSREEEEVCAARACAREAADCGPQPASAPKKTDCPTKGNPQWTAFLSCWAVYPLKQGQEDAWREWMRLHENRTLAEAWVIRDAILVLLNEDSRWKRGMIPKMAKWLNGKGWDDQPYQEPDHAPEAGGLRANTVSQAASRDRETMAAALLQRRGERNGNGQAGLGQGGAGNGDRGLVDAVGHAVPARGLPEGPGVVAGRRMG